MCGVWQTEGSPVTVLTIASAIRIQVDEQNPPFGTNTSQFVATMVDTRAQGPMSGWTVLAGQLRDPSGGTTDSCMALNTRTRLGGVRLAVLGMATQECPLEPPAEFAGGLPSGGAFDEYRRTQALPCSAAAPASPSAAPLPGTGPAADDGSAGTAIAVTIVFAVFGGVGGAWYYRRVYMTSDASRSSNRSNPLRRRGDARRSIMQPSLAGSTAGGALEMSALVSPMPMYGSVIHSGTPTPNIVEAFPRHKSLSRRDRMSLLASRGVQ